MKSYQSAPTNVPLNNKEIMPLSLQQIYLKYAIIFLKACTCSDVENKNEIFLLFIS